MRLKKEEKEQNLNFITRIENNSLEKYYLIDLKLKKKQDKYFSSFSKICDEALEKILSTGKSPSDELIERFSKNWDKNLVNMYKEYTF